MWLHFWLAPQRMLIFSRSNHLLDNERIHPDRDLNNSTQGFPVPARFCSKLNCNIARRLP